MREPGIRGCTPNAQKHTAIPNSKAKPRPTWCGATSPAPRPPTGPWTTSRTCAPAGVAVPLDGHRPERPYCGGLVVLRANDGGHRYIGAGVGQIALLRAGKRDIPRRPRRPVHQQAYGRVGARQRRAPVLQPHRQPPRQRGGGIVLRGAEERDVLQAELPDRGFRQARGDRVHRSRLATTAAGPTQR